MRVLIATVALQIGSALVSLRNKQDHLQGHDHLLEEALQEHYLGLGDTATTPKLSREKPVGTTHDSHAHCEDAPEGSICFKAIMYLKETGFRRHPDWYPEHSAESPFQDVQVMLNAVGKSDCPIPCAIATDQRNDMTVHDEKLQDVEADVGTMEEKGDGALAKMAQTFKVMSKIESKPAAQDETAAEIEAEMLQAMGKAKAQLESPTIANVKATEEGEDRVHAKMAQMSKEMKKIEGKTVALDETTAAEIEAEMLQVMRHGKDRFEASTNANVKAKMAQWSKEMKKIEGKTVAQDETAADIDAEMLQAMGNPKAQLEAPTIARDIEAEMLQAMADATTGPEVSTGEAGDHAKMAQMSKVMKNFESKPAAQNEDAEIEAEMLRAVADARLGPRA